jgi:3-phenylpropionate/cinnamic acid dioxygenase small subunit
MLKKLLAVAVVFVIGYAGYQTLPVYVRYQHFKDGVRDTALFAGQQTDDALKDRIMELAAQHNVPVDRNERQIHRETNVEIAVSYDEVVEVLPRYVKTWHFDIYGRP